MPFFFTEIYLHHDHPTVFLPFDLQLYLTQLLILENQFAAAADYIVKP